jgi:thioredoxin 1
MQIKDIESHLISKPSVLLYFYSDNCAPCKILRPKVQNLIESNFPNIDFHLVNAEQFPAISAHYGIFASPALLVFFEGKEYIRESKNISIIELHDKIERIYKMIF